MKARSLNGAGVEVVVVDDPFVDDNRDDALATLEISASSPRQLRLVPRQRRTLVGYSPGADCAPAGVEGSGRFCGKICGKPRGSAGCQARARVRGISLPSRRREQPAQRVIHLTWDPGTMWPTARLPSKVFPCTGTRWLRKRWNTFADGYSRCSGSRRRSSKAAAGTYQYVDGQHFPARATRSGSASTWLAILGRKQLFVQMVTMLTAVAPGAASTSPETPSGTKTRSPPFKPLLGSRS